MRMNKIFVRYEGVRPQEHSEHEIIRLARNRGQTQKLRKRTPRLPHVIAPLPHGRRASSLCPRQKSQNESKRENGSRSTVMSHGSPNASITLDKAKWPKIACEPVDCRDLGFDVPSL